MDNLLNRDMYEISSEQTPIHGVKLRGTLRKRAKGELMNLLVENANDTDQQCVRFCVLNNEDIKKLTNHITSIVPDALIKEVLKGVQNPVLSKLKVNIDNRY